MKLASILEKVILAIQTYRTMLISQGFSSCEIHERLISLLQLTQSQLNDLDRNSQQSVQSLIQIYLGKHTSVVKAMTELLVNVEAQIILFKENIDEEDDDVEEPFQLSPAFKKDIQRPRRIKSYYSTSLSIAEQARISLLHRVAATPRPLPGSGEEVYSGGPGNSERSVFNID